MNSKKRIAFYTLGCKLNFSETSTISRQFGMDDFEVVDFSETADIYVIHTCSVTAVAEKKCRTAIHAAHRRNPQAHIAVLGCAVEANSGIFSQMESVDWVLGNQDKFKLGELVSQSLQDNYGHGNIRMVSDINKTKEFIPSYSVGDRTRSFFKVQDGCDHFCTYCSIPFMRGRSRSADIKSTIQTGHEIARSGIKEIILTGVNIGDFGKHTGENFYELVQELAKLEGIERIRISSIEPELLTHEIIDFVARQNKIMPHFHIPLQSGNDKVLLLMKRNYERSLFAKRVEYIKNTMPDACIAADVIVGFPGETDEDFQDAYNFIESLPISYLHVFSYSERPRTKAIAMDGKVNEKEKQYRSKALHELSEKKKLDFYNQNIGKTENVLWESTNAKGYMFGFTGNYIKVRTLFNSELVNKISTVKITGIIDDNCCASEIIKTL